MMVGVDGGGPGGRVLVLYAPYISPSLSCMQVCVEIHRVDDL